MRTAAGAGAATLVGGTASARAQGSTSGRMVMIYDDAPTTDYETAFPVHRDLDAPACVAPPSQWVGNRKDTCTVDQIQEMSRAGFEVLAHTREHASLTGTPLLRDVEPSDAKVYPKFKSHAYHSYPIEITDGESSVSRQVVRSGEDDHGIFIELADEVGTSFEANETVERLSDDTLQYVLSNSQASLRHMGFGADSLVVPYDRYTPHVEELAREFYDSVANAKPDGKLNDPADIDPFGLHRWYFVENADRADRFHRLDRIAREDKFAILGAHTFKENVTAEKIQDVIQGAQERGIEILTLREALDAYGVTGSDASATPSASTASTDAGTDAATGTGTGTPATAAASGGDPTATPAGGEGGNDLSDAGLGAAGLGAGALAVLGGWRLWRDD